MKAAGIYIHIPFCKHICNYCDYCCIKQDEYEFTHFVKMLKREIDLTVKDYKENWFFDTIYFGGGSPALLNPENIYAIIHKLNNLFNFKEDVEITLELNPDEAEESKLSEFFNIGINRLSIGFQSLDPFILNKLSRTHSIADCYNIYENARKVGINNISIDMLYNVPTQSIDIWIDNIQKVATLNPNHLAIYQFAIEKNTPFYQKLKSKCIQSTSLETELQMFIQASKFLTDSGFTHYEVSHFSKDSKECRHNKHYWNLEPYLAFGPSAHGYNGKQRWWNFSSLDKYLDSLSKYQKPISDFENLTFLDQINEIIIFGLRTNKGISKKDFQNFPYNKAIDTSLKKWENYLDLSNNTIRIKPGHYNLADEIALEMIYSK